MKYVLAASLLTIAAFAAEPIGKQYTIGNLEVLQVADMEEFTIYVRSTNCQAQAVKITAITETNRPTKILSFIGCGSTPSKVVFQSIGVVKAVSFHVLTGLESYTSVDGRGW